VDEPRSDEPSHIGKERSVARVAAGQQRVIRVDQLHAIGLSDRVIAARARAGRLVRRHRGVYVVGPGELSIVGCFVAAVFAIGPDALLDDVSAAHLWGFWPYLKASDPVHVIVPRKVRQRVGIKIRSVKAIDPRDIQQRNRIPVVTPSKALLGMADTLWSDGALRRAVHEAEVQKRVNHRQLHDQIARAGNTRPARRLAAAIAAGPMPTRSYNEDAVTRMLIRNGFPRFRTNTRIAGLPTWIEVDIKFVDHPLVIEVDSVWHDTEIRRESDWIKQATIESYGIRVVRIRDEDASGIHEASTAAYIWAHLREVASAA
jgi:very-short-patch-repair endonuclease